MIRKLLLAAALVLCAAVPAAAQDEPTPGETAAIREFLEVSRARDNFIRGMELGMEMGGMMELTDEVRQVVREVMDEHFSYDDMEADFIRLYAELFTEDEIRAYTAFYRTPAGARLVELTPELTAGIQKFTMERMMEAMPVLMERVMETMEDEEKTPAESSKS